MFTHVPNQEASLRSWKARRCHRVLEILKANPLSQGLLVVRMIHSQPEVSWDQLSQSLNGRSSPCLLMNWKCLCLLEPAQGSTNTVPISLKETGSHYWILHLEMEGTMAGLAAPFSCAFLMGNFDHLCRTGKIVSLVQWGANWRLYC